MDLNGFTKDGGVAGDYLSAGRDPRLPRKTNFEEALRRLLDPEDATVIHRAEEVSNDEDREEVPNG